MEQVVVEWIQLPADEGDSQQKAMLTGMEAMSTPELVEIAGARTPMAESARLRELLQLQQQRELSAGESNEAAQLVEQEDLLTLRKAKALYLLKRRKALPPALTPHDG